MKTYTPEEYQKKYGTGAYVNLLQTTNKKQEQPKSPGLFSRVADKVKGVVQNSANQINDAIGGQGEYAGTSIPRRVTGAVAGGFNALAGTAIGVPVQLLGEDLGNTKVMQNFVTNHPKAASNVEKVATTLSDPIGAAGNKIGGSQTAQNFVTAHPTLTKFLEETAGTLKNTGEIAGNILLANQGANFTQKRATETANVAKDIYSKTKSTNPPKPPDPPGGTGAMGAITKNVVNDVLPSVDRGVNYLATKALNLTASDVKNISQSTGNEVGQYLAKKNLIRGNVAETRAAIEADFKTNYTAVRNEIAKVNKPYVVSSVPRYVEALKTLKSKVDEVPGLQKDSVEIENLLNKKQPTLNDVQRVKELVDKHTDLYKATGDVKEGIQKQGLDTIRKELQTFIEKEVKKNTGADIREMNNSVSTSKGILKAVDARSTSGLTQSMVQPGDFGAFISGTVATGNPFVGMAAVFVKKLLQSPTIQLKIAKYLDSISDARKAAIQEDLRAGKIPQEFDQFIKK